MDAVEKAIRNAFEKGDASDQIFREKIYRSVFAALERSLAAKPDLSTDAVRARRESLKTKITRIESEFIPAAPTPPRVDMPAREAAPSTQPNGHPAADDDFMPRVERDDRRGGAERPQKAQSSRPEKDAPRPRQKRRRRPFALMFLIVTLAAFIGIGLWWTMGSGLFLSFDERDGSVPNPSPALEDESFTPRQTGSVRQAQPAGDWITVFTPSDPTTVVASDGAQVAVQQGEQPFLRIQSAGASGVAFTIGQGVLEALVARRAIFSVEARTEEGEETQISISCDFGALGNCGRTRYGVGATRAEYLFEVNFPDQEASSGGRIVISPDIAAGGKGLDIFAIRAVVAE